MRFLVLGPLEVMADDRPVAIAGSKERMLLACLIAHAGSVAAIDDLVEELWGESPPRTVERTLASYVSRLRRALGSADLIASRGGGYSLQTGPQQIDADRFEALAAEGHRLLAEGGPQDALPALEEALGLWRGAAYQDFRYTGFGRAEGERLEELRRTAIEDRVDAGLSAGDPGQLVAELEAMVVDAPLREHRWAQLMLALYRSGRQAEALQAFTRARTMLTEELGIEPGPELQRLQSSILAQDGELDRALPAAADPVLPSDVCPYKGLARFETADAGFYFGRERLVSEAVGDLVDSRFLALVGSSGSGKSSLLRAGIMHALEAGAIPGSEGWATTVVRPGDHPADAWALALRTVGEGSAVIALDQFEEIFTACADETERTRFLDALASAVLEPEGRIRVVIAMRADFYGPCGRYRALASLLASNQILVGAMDGPELRRAIELPAERAGLEVQDALADALVADTLDQPGALPLLSTALLELWMRRSDRTLRLEDHRLAGGVEGAVARLAEEAFGRLDADEQAAAKRILLRLAGAGDGAEVVRRRAPLPEFDLERDAGASRALAVLTDARLVTVSEGSVEVSHEALLREWPRLRGWLEDDAEGRRLHRHLTGAAQTWDEGGRDAGDLYRGARLTATADLSEQHGADLNELERQFLRSSRAASEGEDARARRANRRLRVLLVGVAALLVVSLVVGNLALAQRDEARRALATTDAGRLASRSLVEEDPVLALILAREAVHLNDSAETRSALFAALERGPSIASRTYAPGDASRIGDETQWIAVTPDGRTLAIGDSGDRVEFFDASTRAPTWSIEVDEGTDRAAFSPDGQTLAIATASNRVIAIDVAAHSVRADVPAGGTVDALAFSPDGATLLTAENVEGRESLVPRHPTTLQPSAATVDAGRVEDAGSIPPFSPFSIAFASDGSLVTTSSSSSETVLRDADLRPVRRFPLGGDGVAVGPDGSVAAILANSDDIWEGDVAFLSLRTGDVRVGSHGHSGQGNTHFEATGAAFTPDGRSVVTVGNDSRLLVWDVGSASVTERLGGTGDLPLRGPALSTDGATAFTTDRTRDIVAWDLSGRQALGTHFIAGSGNPRWPWFAMSADGRLIAVISTPPTGSDAPPDALPMSGTIRILGTTRFDVVGQVHIHDGLPEALAFSPDSSTLAVSTWNSRRDTGSVRTWDVASGTQSGARFEGVGTGETVLALRYSPGGRELVGAGYSVGAGGRVYTWSAATGSLQGEPIETKREVNDIIFTPDGSRLVASIGYSDGGEVAILDAASGGLISTKRADDAAVYASDVSSDGRTLITAGQTSGIRFWDLGTMAPQGPPLTGLTNTADTVDLSPDGRLVLATDEGGHAIVWDVATGSIVGDPLPGPGPTEALAAAFTPDGQRAIVISTSGAGWSWEIEPSTWPARACEIAGRSLTPQEWARFVPDRAYHATCGL